MRVHVPSTSAAPVPGGQRGSEVIVFGIQTVPCPRMGVASSGQRNSLGERLRWCHPAERLSRPRVERAGDGVKLSLGALRQI